MKYLITIIGPTAIGKTALSIRLAQHFNCDIISCDSRQFFKEMSIGTAAPTNEELAAAEHHFIHNKSIFDTYTVGDFEKEAIAKLDDLFKTNDFAVMVGGSGLYVDAVLKGFDDFPEIAEIETGDDSGFFFGCVLEAMMIALNSGIDDGPCDVFTIDLEEQAGRVRFHRRN